ncbi:MAG: cation transporter [Verrucomicrobiales bacterium]|nr:cation transporter [Verrucomicrobiales bacterium]
MSEHDHHHHHSSENLKVAFFLNLGFTLLEVVGGIWTNSVAILTDAVHDFGDSLSLGLAWYFDKYSKREHTPGHTFGYRRYRLLGGLITGVLLLVGLGFVLYHSIERLSEPAEVRVPGMIALAVLGIAFNGAAVLRVKHGTSLTEKIVSWHLIEDTLGWIAVLIGSLVMLFWDLPIIDPIMSIGIAVFVLWNVIRNLGKVGKVFLQASPEGFDPEEFRRSAEAIEGVESVHHLHSWSVDGESHVFSAHVVRKGNPDEDLRIKNEIRALLDEFPFEHVTLEIENIDDSCPQRPSDQTHED